MFEKVWPSLCKYSYPELAKWHTKVNDQLWMQNEKSGWILWMEYLNICSNACSNQKWNKILFYFVEDIRWTDISIRSEYVVDIWVLRNNRKMLISRVIFWNQLLAVARRITKQDYYTKFMLSPIAIATWLFSKASIYLELGQIRNWQNNCTALLHFFFFLYLSYFLPIHLNLRGGHQMGFRYNKCWRGLSGIKDVQSVWNEFVQCEKGISLVKR